jgi:hypothetical protein
MPWPHRSSGRKTGRGSAGHYPERGCQFRSGFRCRRPGLYNELDRIAEIMIKYPQTSIQVEGHTDSTGSETYNQQAFRTAGQQCEESFGAARGPGSTGPYPGLRREPPGGDQYDTGRAPDEPSGGNPHQSQRPGIIHSQTRQSRHSTPRHGRPVARAFLFDPGWKSIYPGRFLAFTKSAKHPIARLSVQRIAAWHLGRRRTLAWPLNLK